MMGASNDAVAAVERALRQRGRRLTAVRWTVRLALGGVAIAAAGGLVFALRRPALTPTEGSVVHQQTEPARAGGLGSMPADRRALMVTAEGSEPWALTAGTRVSASERGPVRIASSDGTVLTLDPGSALTVGDLGSMRRFVLLRGAVHAQVSKLGQGERFVIDTADAEVEVRGTAFRVATGVVNAGCEGRAARGARVEDVKQSTTTLVSVEEGVVAVRAGGHEARLYPGDTWPYPCPASVRPLERQRERSVVRRRAPPAGSKLAAQNDLFSAAVAARKAGRKTESRELFERLIREHPRSSLVESAMAARMRLLAATEAVQAAAAAAEYLDRFPDGFARTEAEALLQVTGKR